jgi:DNA-binding transcriptional ArsR family regulator
MSNQKENDLDRLFKAIGDHRRRKLLMMLRNIPMTTGYICQVFNDLDRCSVMKHLKVLEEAKLIKVKRVGKFRWNYINVTPMNSSASPWLAQFLD